MRRFRQTDEVEVRKREETGHMEAEVGRCRKMRRYLKRRKGEKIRFTEDE